MGSTERKEITCRSCVLYSLFSQPLKVFMGNVEREENTWRLLSLT